VSEQCVNLHPERELNEHNLPCVFDWASEPLKVGRSGKVLAASAQLKPPKRCTKACRHYTPRGAVDYSHLPNYTAEQVRDREIEMLGVYLSSSPFDQVPAHVMAEMYTAEDLVIAENGVYPMVAMITGARADPKGRDFGFATFATPAGDLTTIVFARQWEQIKPKLRKGAMCFIVVIKTADDRYRLDTLDLVRRFTEEELHDRQAEKILTGGAREVQ
jgi:DNA polymerase III alpha subunit